MDKSIVVQSVAQAIEVFGDVVVNDIEAYSGATKAANKKRGAMQASMFDAGIPAWSQTSPKKDKEKQDKVITLTDGSEITWLQAFDAGKVAIAAGRGKEDLELFLKDPAELSESKKVLRNELVRAIGSTQGKVNNALITKEQDAAFQKAQDEEDAYAQEFETDEVILSKSEFLSPTRSDEVRIGEAIIKCIKVAQAALEPDYDATALIKGARELLVIVGQTDTTTAA